MMARTLVSSSELVCEHGVDNCLYVTWVRVTGAIVDFRFANTLVGCVAGLQDIQRPTHVAFRELEKRFPAVIGKLDADRPINFQVCIGQAAINGLTFPLRRPRPPASRLRLQGGARTGTVYIDSESRARFCSRSCK